MSLSGKIAREFEVREHLRNAALVSTRNAGFAYFDFGLLGRFRLKNDNLLLSEATLIDQGGLRRPAMISGSPILPIELMKGEL